MPLGGGSTSILAGAALAWFQDGQGTIANFNSPRGLAVHLVTGMVYTPES